VFRTQSPPLIGIALSAMAMNEAADGSRSSSAAVAAPPSFSDSRGLGAVAVRAGALGVLFGAHAMLLAYAAGVGFDAALAQWAMYGLALSTFHFLEFALTALHRPADVTADSFLLNHSAAYGAAMAAAALEFWAEYAAAPWLKGNAWVTALGVLLVVGGQAVRSSAMHTAGSNFTHLVAHRRRHDHQLVTEGVYARLRHPSYFGWFWWSVGTQLLLGNPICALGYTAASWLFFQERIPYEEMTLCDFFGQAYLDYARRTVIGIPFIKEFPGVRAARYPGGALEKPARVNEGSGAGRAPPPAARSSTSTLQGGGSGAALSAHTD
jgi:protein-S-isoprenylcysteine O-methyltransferase